MTSPHGEGARLGNPAHDRDWVPLGVAAAQVIADLVALVETVRTVDRFVARLDSSLADSPSLCSAGSAS